MRRYAHGFLLMLLWMPLGCGGGQPPPPPLTEDIRAAVQAEDAAVEAEESRN